jgi:hypothetical protein
MDSASNIAVGTPPSDCVAPCVWDVIKDCLPVGPCIGQPLEQQPGSGDETSLDCAPDNDWWGANFSTFTRGTYDVYVRGSPCFHFRSSSVDGVFGFTCETWSDGAGNVRARVLFSGPVYCGTPEALNALGSCSGPRIDPATTGATAYAVDPSKPHCAPWANAIATAFGVNCRAGCCPGTSPVQPNPY